jgi:hypothetical protein
MKMYLHSRVCIRAPGELEKSFTAWGFLFDVQNAMLSFDKPPGELEKSFAAWGFLVEIDKRIAL